jgi:amino acid adenylation domain-containing protein/thioester reductase-like protein
MESRRNNPMTDESYYERQLMVSRDNLEARDFWLEKLSGEIRKSALPYDRCDLDTSEKRYTWNKVQLNIDPELSAKLITSSKQSDYALHIILAAGLALLFAKYTYNYTNNKDIIIGSPIYRQEIEGEFINTIIPLRIQVKEDRLSFKELLMQVKQSVLEAVNHQNYPVELLIQQLDLPFEPGSQQDFPLFDTFILLENIHDRKFIQHINLNTIISFSRTGDQITGELEFNTQRFEKNTIQQIAGHFTSLLKRALFNANLKLSQIEVLTDDEKKQVLEEFNRTDAEYPAHKTLQELFVEQAGNTPDNIAVIGPILGAGIKPHLVPIESVDANIHGISYKALNECTNRLAQLLRRKGIKTGNIAAIIAERSIEMVIAVLAILKAGGAYLPIEPNNPGERITYILADSRASLLLTHQEVYEIGMKEQKGKPLEIEMLFIEKQFPGLDSGPKTPIAPDTHPGNLAYVIYTSGTTGRPKGVMVEHRSVVNYTYWRLKNYNFTEKDVTFQPLSYSFDGFASNFYSSLFSGGVLVMTAESKRLDYEYIKKIVKERGVTHISLVPTMYEALLNCSETGDLKNLRSVVLGGERAPDYLVKRSEEKIPGILHIIEYGPTEATIGAVANIGFSPIETSIIGKPIANIRVFILDRLLNPQPKGAAGELYIAGTGVARGYINRPEMTAEKFILPHSLRLTADRRQKRASSPGELSMSYELSAMSCLYRTGDLARWLSDGNIEFLGRIDQQVKIKGFRVELGEIENCLRQHKDIETAIVVTRQITRDNQEESELIAYYKTKNTITSQEIWRFLAHELPEYMIPSHFMELDEFPMTANGKVNRKSLALPGKYDLVTEKECAQPRNEIEMRILQVWKEVIGIEDVGIDNNFFSIGGTSIKALAVVSQLSREIDINIDHLYTHGTVAEIAKSVTWQKDSMKMRIQEIKEDLKSENPKTWRISEEREKQLDMDHKAYVEKIEKENLPSLTEKRDYRHILLTGSTGLLGANLLDEILRVTGAQLHLLIKADSREEAEGSLKKRLTHYFGKNYYDTNKERFHVFYGDIREEKLGITDEQYEKLSEIIDAVVHTAADVRHYGMYEDFYKVNVAGTEYLLELAAQKKKKDFHHMSTMGVGTGNIEGKSTLLFSEFCHDEGQKDENVYLKTKLESEKKILSYREEGIDASIYRVGHLVCHSQTGIFQENIEMDAFYAQLKGFVTLGGIPNIGGMFLDMSFVDHTAAAFVRLMTRKNLQNETYHLNNTKNITWPEMVPILNKTGVNVKLMDVEPFLDHLMECMEKKDHKYMQAISRLLLHAGLFGQYDENTAPTTTVRYCNERTQRILKHLNFEWVKPTEAHIREMIRHCQDVKFF